MGCVTLSVIYILIAHTQEPMKLLHLYELLYKRSYLFSVKILSQQYIYYFYGKNT